MKSTMTLLIESIEASGYQGQLCVYLHNPQLLFADPC